MTSAAGDPDIPRHFGNYEVIELIGQVGGTRMYRAKQTNLGRVVTVTVLPAHLAEKPAYRQRFERQFAAASRLRHPNIRAAIDAGEVDGHRFIVAESGDGRRLQEALDEGEWFGQKRSVVIALDIAHALEYLEGERFVHRHVTPSEILLVESGIAKLRGFSFSKQLQAGSNETWFDADPYWSLYTAPEFVRSEDDVDTRADIYSLGCVLFHLLTGRTPFVGTNAAVVMEQHVRAEPPDPRTLRDNLSVGVGAVVMRCLEKDRDRRYSTAAELVADLEAVKAGSAPAAAPAPQGRLRLRRRGRRGSR